MTTGLLEKYVMCKSNFESNFQAVIKKIAKHFRSLLFCHTLYMKLTKVLCGGI